MLSTALADQTAALTRIEDRLAAAVAKLGADTQAAALRLQRVLAAQTQSVTRALQQCQQARDLRAAGPQVLALVAAVHGASARCAVPAVVPAELQGLLDDVRRLRAALAPALPPPPAGAAPEPAPAEPAAVPHPPGSPWAVAGLADLDELFGDRHPRFDVYRVEEDRLSVLRTEGPRWSLALAVRPILLEHRRQGTFYGQGDPACVPRLTVLTALRRIGAEPSDVTEHAVEIDEAVERLLGEDDFLCALVVDAPLLTAYPQWALWRPLCFFVARELCRLVPGTRDVSAQFAPAGPPAGPRPEEPAVAGARATVACAVLHVMRAGAGVPGATVVALTPAEWVGLQAGFEAWAHRQPWARTDAAGLALSDPLRLRLYPACLRQVLVDRCWDRVRASPGTAQWSLAFWERCGVSASVGYRRPTGRPPRSACGPLASTGCPFVGRPAAAVPRPVADTARLPGPDPRLQPAALRAHREATGDDLDVDPAFNAAGEGSEIDEEELVAGCELPETSGGFGPLGAERAERLARAGERLAERLARVAHVDLPVDRHDPATKFFFGREHPLARTKRQRDDEDDEC